MYVKYIFMRTVRKIPSNYRFSGWKKRKSHQTTCSFTQTVYVTPQNYSFYSHALLLKLHDHCS